MTEQQPEQSRSARAREVYSRQQQQDREEAMARRANERDVARQRQLGVSWLAFKAGFFGALGVALASLIIGIVVGIFWLIVFGAVLGAALSN
jgi:uncharacterized membrane protein